MRCIGDDAREDWCSTTKREVLRSHSERRNLAGIGEKTQYSTDTQAADPDQTLDLRGLMFCDICAPRNRWRYAAVGRARHKCQADVTTS